MPIGVLPVAGGGGGGGASSLDVVQANGYQNGQAVYFDGALWQLARANVDSTLGIGILTNVTGAGFTVNFSGPLSGLPNPYPLEVAGPLVAGQYYFVSAATAGALTATEPATFSNPLLFALSATEAVVLPYRPSEVTSGGGGTISTTTSASFTQPSVRSVVVVSVASTTGMACGDVAYIERGGAYVVNEVRSATQVGLMNLGFGQSAAVGSTVAGGSSLKTLILSQNGLPTTLTISGYGVTTMSLAPELFSYIDLAAQSGGNVTQTGAFDETHGMAFSPMRKGILVKGVRLCSSVTQVVKVSLWDHTNALVATASASVTGSATPLPQYVNFASPYAIPDAGIGGVWTVGAYVAGLAIAICSVNRPSIGFPFPNHSPYLQWLSGTSRAFGVTLNALFSVGDTRPSSVAGSENYLVEPEINYPF